jgi:hypothetical protein
MQVINTAVDRSHVELDRNELLIMNAALNEICNGIALFEFETRIGADRERVAALLKQVGSLLDKMDLSHE